MIYTSLHPPPVHPSDGMQAPLKIPDHLNAHSDVEQSRLYSGPQAKSSLQGNFFRASCPAGVLGRTFTHLQQSFPPFDSSLEKPRERRRGLPWAGRIVRERRMHAPDEPCLHRVLHELRLLSPGRQSGGRDRAEARRFPRAGPQQWWSLRNHLWQRPDLLQEEAGAFSATWRGRAGAAAAALRLIPLA